MKCPNCGSECCISAYNEYKCEACGVTFAVNQNFSAAADADETDKTIPPRREHEFNAADDVTMPGRRDRKKDGAFEAGDLVINRYRVISKLGQGGMGAVYKCLDETAGIEIALKALPPELSNNTLEMEDIKDNFQLVSKLVHQNIANLRQLEKDNSNGNYYLIMECCNGEDLRRWIRNRRQSGKISVADILPIISQIADALDYAHDQKIIHRSLQAIPTRSASGSVAITMSALIFLANSIAIERASAFSGFGEITVGKSPLLTICSSTQ